MPQCKQCGQSVRFKHLFDWLNATYLSLDCYCCGRTIAGIGSWVFVYAASGALVVSGILTRGDIKELLYQFGIDVPGWAIIGGLVCVAPVPAFLLAFLIAWKNA